MDDTDGALCPPTRLYRNPETPLVADFIGGANVVKGAVSDCNSS
jgi:ABC-type Fe3+/spermidine/putrescine transport system ATPase subunit